MFGAILFVILAALVAAVGTVESVAAQEQQGGEKTTREKLKEGVKERVKESEKLDGVERTPITWGEFRDKLKERLAEARKVVQEIRAERLANVEEIKELRAQGLTQEEIESMIDEDMLWPMARMEMLKKLVNGELELEVDRHHLEEYESSLEEMLGEYTREKLLAKLVLNPPERTLEEMRVYKNQIRDVMKGVGTPELAEIFKDAEITTYFWNKNRIAIGIDPATDLPTLQEIKHKMREYWGDVVRYEVGRTSGAVEAQTLQTVTPQATTTAFAENYESGFDKWVRNGNWEHSKLDDGKALSLIHI